MRNYLKRIFKHAYLLLVDLKMLHFTILQIAYIVGGVLFFYMDMRILK